MSDGRWAETLSRWPERLRRPGGATTRFGRSACTAQCATRAAVPPSLRGRDQRGPNVSNGLRQIVLNQACVQPEHAIAEASELVIAACIGGVAVLMVGAAIDLDDELGRGSEKVDDEPLANHDLAPELDTETATAKHQLPEPLLTRRWTLTHGVSALSEERGACGAVGTKSMHRVSWARRGGRAQPPNAQEA